MHVSHDPVNSPSHYTQNGTIECIEAIAESMSLDEFKGFLKGNVIKYTWRYRHKNGCEDLKKARWYLNRLIDILDTVETNAKEISELTQEVLRERCDPDAYMISGCPDGFCPMPGVRQGPPAPMFHPV